MTEEEIVNIAECVAAELKLGIGGRMLYFAAQVAKRAVEIEREACAELCERHAAEPLILRAMKISERPFSGAALDCAELIRMRYNAELTGDPLVGRPR